MLQGQDLLYNDDWNQFTTLGIHAVWFNTSPSSPKVTGHSGTVKTVQVMK
jgi:hypothetical protein